MIQYRLITVMSLICLMAVPFLGATAAGGGEFGTVAGTISVSKTKVRTQGPKSDKDVIVFLEDLNGRTWPAADGQITSVDQKGLVFIPHVLPIQKGRTVRFLNSDSVEHNVYFLFEKTGKTIDIGTYQQGISVDYTFEESGVVIVLCKLHLEMAAHIVVLDNPLFCLAEIKEETQAGSYSLDNVPPGRYILKAWHKNLKMQQKQAEITVEAGKVTNLDITITKSKYVR
jgi:plastocyanin